MARPRKSGVSLPPHVHKVVAKGKDYYFYQPHRGTARQGKRVALPRDPQSVEFWDALRQTAGAVAGYTGTVAAMIDAYIASEEFKPSVLAESTRRSYKLYLGHARLALGQHSPNVIRPSHIIALRDQFAETPVAANTIVAALRTVYKWGILRDHATSNPCAGVPKLKGGKEHQPWPQEAIEAVLANARWEVRRFVLLTLYTGQREGDVCAMSLHDVEDGMIRVIQEKTGKELWIPIHRELRPVIEDARNDGTLAILPRGNGESFDANNFRAMWGREMKKPALAIVKRLGLVPHGLCKNAHNLLFEAGNSNKEVQSVTGRSAPMIAHYSKGVDQKKLAKRAVERSEETK